MFNLYYMNYEKAFEIAMQVDNKVLEKQVKEKDRGNSGDGQIGVEAPEGLLSRLLPKLQGNVSFSVSKSEKTEDTLKVVSTKSTILAPVIKKAVEVKKLGEDRIGKLLKIKDVSLSVMNYQDMMGSKILLSGLLQNVPIDGIGPMDLTAIANTVLKGASYIVVGKIPEKVSVVDPNSSNKLLLKIPMQMENEMENSYSISDLEIGPVTVVGIYRGIFKFKDIKNQVDAMAKMSGLNSSFANDSEIETEDSKKMNTQLGIQSVDLVHYIDVISIIQELF